MKLEAVIGVLVLAKGSRDSNGNTYYNLAVLQDSQAGTLSCKKDVFDLVAEMKPYQLGVTYNDQYKSLSVDKVIKDLSVSEKGVSREPSGK